LGSLTLGADFQADIVTSRCGNLRRGVLVAISLLVLARGLRADFPLNPFRKSPSPQDPFAARGGLGPIADGRASSDAPAARVAQYQPPPQSDSATAASGDPGLNYRPPAATLPPIAQPIARIGDDTIFDVEVAGPVNQQLAQRARPGMSPREIEALRRDLTKQALASVIDQKVVVYKARREIPADVWPKVEKSVNEQFEKTHLKELMTRANAKTRQELDRILQQSGTSIERQKKSYLERSLAAQWIRKEVNYEPEVTHQEMLDHYQKHRDEYLVKGRVNWEELAVRFDKFPTKDAAYQAIAEMGNEVFTGRPFIEVARAKSQGITASQGGGRGWTNQGSLTSEALDGVLFTMRPGTLSRILEDPRGFYIVRVIERQDAAYKNFVDVQTEIRDKIRKEKVDRGVKDYLAKLRAHTPVWTIFDEPADEERAVQVSGSTP
jgi:parvulin-like peptidyl-prolyl isomerase